MLKKLRGKKTAKRILIFLAIIIVPAFVLWGSGSVTRNRNDPAFVGSISGRKVSLLDYREALDAVRVQAFIRFGDNLPEAEKYLNLESQAWDRLLLLAEAKKRRLSASDREVVDLIASYPFFKNKGRFDNKIYSSMLQYEFRVQPRAFEEQARQNLVISKLFRSLTDNIRVSEEDIKEGYRRLNEQISLDYIASLPSQFAKDISFSDEEVRNYFLKENLQFKQPLSFNIEYVMIPLGEEKATKEKIKNAFLRLRKKEELNKIAKDLDIEAKETGMFAQAESIPGIGWSPQIMGFISKLKTGECLAPVRMDRYYYLLRLKTRKEPHIPEFETIKTKVREALIKYSAQKIARERIEMCLKKLKTMPGGEVRPASFARAAKECGLKTDSTALFKYDSYLEGIGVADIFWTTAQSLKASGFSDIIQMPSGFYIIQLKTKVPFDEKKFSQEKEEFAQRLLLQKKEESFVKFIEDLKRKAQIVAF